MGKREVKEPDDAEKALRLLKIAMNGHPEILYKFWFGAFWKIMIAETLKEGMPFEVFCEQTDLMKDFYKEKFKNIKVK